MSKKKHRWKYLDEDGSLNTQGCGCCSDFRSPEDTTLDDLKEIEQSLADQLGMVKLRIGILETAAMNKVKE